MCCKKSCFEKYETFCSSFISCVLNDHSAIALLKGGEVKKINYISTHQLLLGGTFVPYDTGKSVMKLYMGVFSFNIPFVEAFMQSLISYYYI